MKINSRYDWGIDRDPVTQRFTEGNDIPCCIDIGVEAESTVPTAIPPTSPVRLPDLPTIAASLTRVSGVDVFNTLPKRFGFILQEVLELPESPSPQEFVESFPIPPPSRDVQFLQNKEVGIAFNYLFGDTVVDIGHKPSLSTTETPKMSSTGSSAFTLEMFSQPRVPTFDSTNMLTIEEIIITCNNRVDDASIYPYSLGGFNYSWGLGFSSKIEVSFTCFDVEGCSSYSPREVSLEVVRDNKLHLDSAKSRRHGDNSTFQEGRECVVIKPDSGELLFLGQSLHPPPLEHIAGLVSGCTDEAAVELRELFPYVSVGGLMKLGFIVSLQLESFSETLIAGYIVEPHCVFNTIIQWNLKVDCSLHTNPSDSIYKCQNPLDIQKVISRNSSPP